ncbi:AAA family ATPase [Facilibium subflavum]|uniref:AAA family ATPase n=1 Tax=Facilibium subflavum TaxID=2219058 RepID=UPI000E64BDFB|nr:ATP-binding protein [Facilibium subflavum]
MLVEFSVKNFKSIKEEIKFSLVADNGKELYKENVMEASASEGGKRIPLIKSAALYGPNAGGKTNIIKALAAMRQIVMTSAQEFRKLPIVPFKLSKSTLNLPTEFEVIIIFEGVRYQYGFSATLEKVYDEWLFAFPKGRVQTWFERTWNDKSGKYDYYFGDKLTGDKDVWRRATRDNALFLSTAIQLNSEKLKPVFDWFSNKLHIAGVNTHNSWGYDFTLGLCKKDRSKEEILNFLKAADFSITDVKVQEEDMVKSFSTAVPEHVRAFLEQELPNTHSRILTFHPSDKGDMVELDYKDESHGTQKMFRFSGPWLDSLQKGHVLVVDELNNNLHPVLVQFLVQLFHNEKMNQNHAQLVFSTHETSILNQDIFRRDQIWFCEQRDKQGTSLYPLTDFSPRKGVDNLERAYLSGRYGALPFVHELK